VLGKAVEVFDNEQVTFYFCNNMEDKGIFFNVLCLEETGIRTKYCIAQNFGRFGSPLPIRQSFIHQKVVRSKLNSECFYLPPKFSPSCSSNSAKVLCYTVVDSVCL